MRYDLARRPGRGDGRPAGGPAERHVPHDYDPYEGGPRRIIVSSGMAALIVGGAVGSYFGVVNGLGALLDRPPAPAALPTMSGDSDITAMGTPGAAAAGRERAGRAVAGSGAARADGTAPGAAAGDPAGVSAGGSAGRAVGRVTPMGPPTLETTPDAPDPTPWPGAEGPGYPTDPAYPPDPTGPADPSVDPVDPTTATPWPTDSGEPLPSTDPGSGATGGPAGAATNGAPSWEPTGWENRGRWDGRGRSDRGRGEDRGRWEDRSERGSKAESDGGTWTRNGGAFDCPQ
jgi:hypothetical protein